jgi:hypothetical protein
MDAGMTSIEAIKHNLDELKWQNGDDDKGGGVDR